ncbi:hypothetical protein HanIR_Chr11g0546751 [Helianthus annuus]|nr:hypothetical protein HanIR_Chr11g0546751 [Helianthus annuus]
MITIKPKTLNLKPQTTSIMHNMHVILNNCISCLQIKTVCTCLNIPSSKPKKPTSSYHGHLPHLMKHRVPAQYR